MKCGLQVVHGRVAMHGHAEVGLGCKVATLLVVS